MSDNADAAFIRGHITRLDRSQPEVEAVAVKDGGFVAVGATGFHLGPQPQGFNTSSRHAQHRKTTRCALPLRMEIAMTDLFMALVLGLGIGVGCRWFDLPLPAPPKLVGALLGVAMTLGFMGADYALRSTT